MPDFGRPGHPDCGVWGRWIHNDPDGAAPIPASAAGGPILVVQGGRWVIAGITSATTGVAGNQGTNVHQAIFNTHVRGFIRLHVPAVGER